MKTGTSPKRKTTLSRDRNKNRIHLRTGRKKRSRLEKRINSKEYLSETTTGEREQLRGALNTGLLYFINAERPVHLEKFGLLIPSLQEQCSSYEHEEKIVIRKEAKLHVSFEKCTELIPYQREKFPSVVETQELVQYLYALLPLSMQIQYSEKMIRRLIRGLIQSIRNEVIVDGFSGQLSALGELFALHNRQGTEINDWFAGADILISNRIEMLRHASIQSHFRQPTLTNAWEIFEASYGDPLTHITIDLAEELGKLGYDKEFFEAHYSTSDTSSSETKLNIAAFLQPQKKLSTSPVILFCTNGLRFQSPGETGLGHEFIFQLRVLDTDNVDIKNADLKSELASSLPLAKRALTLAWILHQSFRQKTLTHGRGLSADMPLLSDAMRNKGSLSGIFLTRFTRIPYAQKCDSTSFQYLNVLGVTDDELRFSELRSSEHLSSLLTYKKLDQVTLPQRRSIFHKSNDILNADHTSRGSATSSENSAPVENTASSGKTAIPERRERYPHKSEQMPQIVSS